MEIQVAVPRETQAGEKRVAIVPKVAERLVKLGIKLQVEAGAGAASGIPDESYAKSATMMSDAAQLFRSADIVLGVNVPKTESIRQMREGTLLACFVNARQHVEEVKLLRDRKITTFAMELIPRISRAQYLDALSSQAMVAGYKAAVLAALRLERFFPMLTTAAGTIQPARVLVIGAGVAGLQAIATAKRLGAQVEGYDVRAASREEVESLGAKFVSGDVRAEGEGGYARELTEQERAAQREVLAKHVSRADVVICAANVPGRPAPKILLKSMVESMKTGSVVVDLAADTGGNCELTQAGQEVRCGTVTILGPLNVASLTAEDASQMYANNLNNLLGLIVKQGQITLDWEDEVVGKTILTFAGEIKHEPTRQLVEGAGQK
ncbi:MAG TPA: Re/Si-specific NAD(P)(+) transhydrogenase subunit alpha [Candidatus Acidoferrales bacterium]|nr:Re/Si-specific NAD(P)(+) transhydrogenase subunit alpha [Candidatus Acidoferrales bacterium]